jgi:tetratricopeptide (TPR) repeat protein
MRNLLGLLVLSVLAAVLGYFVYERVGMRMGGSPSSLRSAYPSEEAWIVGEILRDIAEMAAHAHRVPIDSVELSQDLAPEVPLPAVQVSVRAGNLARYDGTLSLEGWLWNADNYAEVAAALLGPGLPSSPREISLPETLLDARASVLAQESARISELLAADMRDASAHEEAALVLAAFALREAAYAFEDIRFLLGRMTAHLAVARSLRGPETPGPAGAIAEAALLTLAGRQQEALAAFEHLPDRSPAGAAWRNALYLYSTYDWRGRPGGGESLLEQVQRFRALVKSLRSTTAVARFETAESSELADWGRIVTWDYSNAASDSSFVTTQMERELGELQEVWTLTRNDQMSPQNLTEALNVQAERLVGETGPRVLGWGTWAAFYQRHIAGILVATHQMLDRSLGMPERAAEYTRGARELFSGLTLHPIVDVRRTRRAGGPAEETLGVDESIALTRRSPELVNARNWEFLADTALHLMRKRGMPEAQSWFSRTILETSVIDTPVRCRLFGNVAGKAERLPSALRRIAPEHPRVIEVVLANLSESEKTIDRVTRELGNRVEFDLAALREIVDVAEEEPEKALPVRERICDLDANECSDLGWALVRLDRPVEAAAAFQRAIDEAPDRIDVCNNTDWIVNYYFDQGRVGEARAIADMAAEVYCAAGLDTRAYFSERMGRRVEAEEWYRARAQRYDSDDPVSFPLMGFYYRMARVQKDAEYEARFEELLSRIFPRGLEPLPSESDAARPSDGVLINGDSRRLREAGLRGGDVIVGLDGYRVRSYDQYHSVRHFQALPSDAREMRLRVWRQTRYLDIDASVLGRFFGVNMRTYGGPGAR